MTGVLITCTGYARSGKDAFADQLVSHHNYVKLAWSDPLCKLALVIDPLLEVGKTLFFFARHERLSSIVSRLGWTDAKTIPSVREFLQRLGTEGVRECLGEDTFVTAVIREVKEHLKNGRNVCITNSRFANEAQAVVDLGGTVVRVHREGVGPVNGHVSDQGDAFQHATFDVHNDGTVEDLAEQALAIHAVLHQDADEDDPALCPEMLLAKWHDTIDRSIGNGMRFIIHSAAPSNIVAREFVDSHCITAGQIEDGGIEITSNGKLIGKIEYEDGQITATAYLAH
jgi:hypothetical protein